MRRTTAYLGLGSNIGDRMGNLREAVARLLKTDGITLVRASPVYQTEPVGYEAQEDFYNMVVAVETSLVPMDLLSAVKEIEKGMGRVEAVHKGPRIIDLDILLYGDEAVDEYRLTIPHPQMLEREFVLRPLFDLDPDLQIRPLSTSVRQALGKIEGVKRVVKVKGTIDAGEVTDD
jgi:2-amino-4-hydroxy-6-hydroxymethyldihydropteridine diphosphokinase